MTNEQLLERVKEILSGIDQREAENDNGWWATSTGAEFGAERLRLIEQAFAEASAS